MPNFKEFKASKDFKDFKILKENQLKDLRWIYTYNKIQKNDFMRFIFIYLFLHYFVIFLGDI